MEAQRLYPIEIQTFERVIGGGYLYIDKTECVYRMTHTNGIYFFLSRPRRFGKSLLISTLHSYFEGKKELFRGLAISNLEKEWTEYPVLHFSMAGGKHIDKEQLERYLDFILQDEEKKWGISCPQEDANTRFINLIKVACEKTGKQVVVLIDEYDAPLLDVVHDEETLPQLRNVMRNFYSPLKDCEPYLRFVFLAGITKFSQMSIFSELNNISNISMDDEYAGICGITEEELLTQMSDDIDVLAGKLEKTREETITALKEHYDGYHFARKSPDIYNPFSLLNAMARGKLDCYWFSSGTPTYLIEMMRKFDVLPSKIGNTQAKQTTFDAPTEHMTSIIPLMYQSGYLTIKDYDKELDLFRLDIPNTEIKVGLYENLLPNYVTTAVDEGKVVVAHMSAFVNRGDMGGALQLLQDFLKTVPYCDNTAYEGHWQQMLYVIFALLSDYRIQVEQHTAKGRTDMTLETQKHIYIVELKFGKSADEALAQINDKRYADAFALRDKHIIKVGINFDMASHNLSDWKVEEARD